MINSRNLIYTNILDLTELFDLVVKHILPGMGLFFYFVLHFNCKFAWNKKGAPCF